MKKPVATLSLLIIATLACQTALPPQATSTATLTASATSTPTKTPVPTRNSTATHAAQETEEMTHILEVIAPDLELAGYSIDQGQLAWEMEDIFTSALTKVVIGAIGSLCVFRIRSIAISFWVLMLDGNQRPALPDVTFSSGPKAT